MKIEPDLLLEKKWFRQLPVIQQELIKQSFYLLDLAKKQNLKLYDYSYILMPGAKAYEGFIKDLVYKLGLIPEKRYLGKRFRVGRAINPDYARTSPDGFEALYDDLSRLCGGEFIASKLWNTWLECRNRIFHYFVGRKQYYNLFEVETKLYLLIETIDQASVSCNLDNS